MEVDHLKRLLQASSSSHKIHFDLRQPEMSAVNTTSK